MTTSAACVCCLSTTSLPHLAGLRRCQKCTHVWADVALSPEEHRRLYAGNYFQGEEYLDYSKEAPALLRNFRRRVAELQDLLPVGVRVWEIGSAYGYFLSAARDVFDARGCDISGHAAAYAHNELHVDVQEGDFLQMKPPPLPHEAVCMWDTIEHLASPELYLEKAHAETAPHGLLVLSTGDIGSLLARIRGRKWRLIHPPTHLHYFTRRSIETLLNRIGYDVLSIAYPVFWRSADAVAFRLLGFPDTRLTAPLYRALRSAGLLNFAIPANTFDLMQVTARKRP